MICEKTYLKLQDCGSFRRKGRLNPIISKDLEFKIVEGFERVLLQDALFL
jgi:hypothetical protein